MSVASLCQVAGMSRQNYYKQRRVRRRQAIDEQLALELVRRERCRQPRLGGRKLLHLIAADLTDAGVSLGRDRFFRLLKAHDLLVFRRRSTRTTQSRHRFKVYPNRAKDLLLTGPHQLWVSDITYLRTENGFMYLALTMDAWSRAIVGYDCSNSLEVVGALRSLKMSIRQLPAGARSMHHSDRGTQYCCHAYIEQLAKAKIAVSMTEENHCYENSQAERLNGTLKGEYSLSATFNTSRAAQYAVDEAVSLYNHARPHQALGYATPMTVHTTARLPAATPGRLKPPGF